MYAIVVLDDMEEMTMRMTRETVENIKGAERFEVLRSGSVWIVRMRRGQQWSYCFSPAVGLRGVAEVSMWSREADALAWALRVAKGRDVVVECARSA